jgi:hypothetical protein
MIARTARRSHRAPTQRVRFGPNWPDVDRLLFDVSLSAAEPGETVLVDVGRHHVLMLDCIWPDVMPLAPGIAQAVRRGVHVLFVGQPYAAASWWSYFYDLEAAVA